MTTIHDTIRLARAFGEQVQETLTVSQFRQVIDGNKAEPENSGICHSHDFCDANVSMHDAFVATFGRNPLDTPSADNIMSDADEKLWNDAWAIAKAADFFA